MASDFSQTSADRRVSEHAVVNLGELPEQKSFHDWLEALNAKSAHKIVIRDFDGLDRGDFERAYRGAPMTERDFQHRLGRCTFNIKI